MWDIIRESTVGEIINMVSGGWLLPYPDQRPDFVIPKNYLVPSPMVQDDYVRSRGAISSNTPGEGIEDGEMTTEHPSSSSDLPTRVTSMAIDEDAKSPQMMSDAPTRLPSSDAIHSETDTTFKPSAARPAKDLEGGDIDPVAEANPQALEKALESAKIKAGDYILVDWYSEDDPENPRNWSSGKRFFVLLEICLLTFSVYIGSAIYTASIPYVTEKFHVSTVTATLGLSLFIEGYALGPMIFSPLQELPSIGRNPVYIWTLFIFALLQIPTALASNLGGLLVLRFLSGFFGSPALATGGASVGDIYAPMFVPFALGAWAMGAVAGPVFGPIVGGFAAAAKGWSWPIWELMWISGFSAVFLVFFLPETLPGTILLKRARRLRKLTGNDRLRSMSEIEQAEMSASAVAAEYLIRPFQLMLEPAILFINIYIGLAYAVFYLWFESFPMVFIGIYHFKGGVSGLPFLGIVVGAFVSYIFYIMYIILYLGPKFVRLKFNVPPEEYLRLSCIAGVFIPISLFMFGWSARPSVHWIVPIIGAGLYMPGIYLLFQSAIVYLPISYPKYAASIFAGNDLFRSSIAAAFPLFGRAFFNRLGLGGGSSLLAGIAILMLPAMWALFLWGSKLRAMSKYTEK